MSGAPDPLYVLARRTLLDGLEALRPHLHSLVVVGAQAIYEHTGPADLAVAESTTDADLAITPELLAEVPTLTELLEANRFELEGDPGKWRSAEGIQFDLLVPEAVAGPGRRGARLSGHGRRAARRVKGLEGALVDHEVRELHSFDPDDSRSAHVAVAGPAALLIAKIHKVAERVDSPGRLVDKDALDILRLLRAVPTQDLADGVQRLKGTELSRPTTIEAMMLGSRLLGAASHPGVRMAVRAAGPTGEPSVIAASLVALWSDLEDAMH